MTDRCWPPSSRDLRGANLKAELAIIELNTGQVTLISDSTVRFGKTTASAQWTPDGSLLLFSGVPGPMHVYQAGDSRATTLDVKVSDSFAVGLNHAADLNQFRVPHARRVRPSRRPHVPIAGR